MSTLADAGIYLLVDLDTFDTYILPVRPVPSPGALWILVCSCLSWLNLGR